MDTQILRKPAAGEVWQHRINGAYYHVVAVTNEENKHDDHPPQVVYRSMRQDNGQPSHWWSRALDAWHRKMVFVSDLNPAVPSVGRVVEINYLVGSHVEVKLEYRIDEILSLPQVGDKVRLYPAPQSKALRNTGKPELSDADADLAFALGIPSIADVCAANHTGCMIGPHGPNGALQCLYCGEPG